MIFLPPRLFLEGYSSAFNGFPECLPHGEGRFQDEFVIFVTCAYIEGGGGLYSRKSTCTGNGLISWLSSSIPFRCRDSWVGIRSIIRRHNNTYSCNYTGFLQSTMDATKLLVGDAAAVGAHPVVASHLPWEKTQKKTRDNIFEADHQPTRNIPICMSWQLVQGPLSINCCCCCSDAQSYKRREPSA